MAEIDHAAYQKKLKNKTASELAYIIKDAREAIAAMPDGPKAGYYQDEIHYASMELKRRQMSEGVAKKYQNPEGGLNAKGRAHFNKQGHNLKPPVSKDKAKKSPKAAGRRKSFCSRMGGQKRMHNIDCRKDPDKDICKSLRKWDCNESFEQRLNAVFD
jgi:hypothetical protein